MTKTDLEYIIQNGKKNCPDGAFERIDPDDRYVILLGDPRYGDVMIVPVPFELLSVAGRYKVAGGQMVPRKFNRILDEYFDKPCPRFDKQ